MPAEDPQQRRPDFSRARAMFGWEPRPALDDGLTETIAWLRDAITEEAPAFIAE